MRNRKWIVCFAIFVMLLAAWGLRWDRLTTMGNNSQRLIYYKDRWTGTTWVSAFGNINGQFYSGQVYPMPSPDDVNALTGKIHVLSNQQSGNQQWAQQAENEARSQLKNQYWHMRNVATGIWAFLLLVSFVLSALFFLREGRLKPARQDSATEQLVSGP